jgi:hypothetical protein
MLASYECTSVFATKIVSCMTFHMHDSRLAAAAFCKVITVSVQGRFQQGVSNSASAFCTTESTASRQFRHSPSITTVLHGPNSKLWSSNRSTKRSGSAGQRCRRFQMLWWAHASSRALVPGQACAVYAWPGIFRQDRPDGHAATTLTFESPMVFL